MAKMKINITTMEEARAAIKQAAEEGGKTISEIFKSKSFPAEFKTEALCREALELCKGRDSDFNFYQVFRFGTPPEVKTAKLCLMAVKRYGRSLDSVPKELRTAELCLEAVKNDGYALGSVPPKLRTEELCVEAVKSSVYALDSVPEALKAQVKKAAGIK